jgi:hypothetical protein
MKARNRKYYVLTGIGICAVLILSVFMYITMPRGKPLKPRQSGMIASVVKEGDIICRLGDRLWSGYFRDVSLTDKRYSHVGIVHINNGTVTVINAEGGTEQGRNFVNESALGDFLSVARTAGVYRIKSTEGDQISALAMEYMGVPFDWQFDMRDESKLYCTELVYVVLKRLLPELQLRTVYIKGLDKEIIPPEAISRSEYFSEVYFAGNR